MAHKVDDKTRKTVERHLRAAAEQDAYVICFDTDGNVWQAGKAMADETSTYVAGCGPVTREGAAEPLHVASVRRLRSDLRHHDVAWVLTGGWDYEGRQVVGVFSTADEAEAAAERVKRGYDDVEVMPHVLGRIHS